MVVKSNIPALNSQRNLGINNNKLAKNLEKLSSGYKINRAADDAAGLAVSEKMRSQIRGLEKAEENTSNAIDLVQTAEGGLNEMHAILQRMRELAVQASNGTYTADDRQQIALEATALLEEIDRISSSTHYNGINLLDGTLGSIEASTVAGTYSGTGPLGSDEYMDGSYTALAVYLKQFGFPATTADINSTSGVSLSGSAVFNVSPSLVGSTANIIVTSGSETGGDAQIALQVGGKTYPAVISDGTNYPGYPANAYLFLDSNGAVLADLRLTPTTSASGTLIKLDPNAKSGVISGVILYDPTTMYDQSTNPSTLQFSNDPSFVNMMLASEDSTISFQIGANGSEDQRVELGIPSMSTFNLGTYVPTAYNATGTVANISLRTRDSANDAIDIIDAAINQVSSVRANLGAMQNRLEHALNSLGIAKENLTAAESTIRDTDMAKEMMKFTQNSILSQASQAMLAQANALPQGVLSLLS